MYRISISVPLLLLLLAGAVTADGGVLRVGVIQPRGEYTLETAEGRTLVLEFYEPVDEVFVGDTNAINAELSADRRKLSLTPQWPTTTNLVVISDHEELVADLIAHKAGTDPSQLTSLWRVEPRGTQSAQIHPTRRERDADTVKLAHALANRLLPAATDAEIDRRIAERHATRAAFDTHVRKKLRHRVSIEDVTLLGDTLYLTYDVRDAALPSEAFTVGERATGLDCRLLGPPEITQLVDDDGVYHRHQLRIDVSAIRPSVEEPTWILGAYSAADHTELYQIELELDA